MADPSENKKPPPASLSQLPLELLFNIIEHELTLADFKSLRLVNSKLNSILAHRLFDKIGFDFERKNTELWITKRGRLSSVEVYKNTAFAQIPREFFVLITKKSPLITSFVNVLSKMNEKLLETFPNISTIVLEIDPHLLDSSALDLLIKSVCGGGTLRGKSIHLKFSNVTDYSRIELPSSRTRTQHFNIETLSLETDASQIRYIVNRLGLISFSKQIISHCDCLNRLDLSGYAYFIDPILRDAVASSSLKQLSHVILYDDPEYPSISLQNRGIGLDSNAHQLSSLKSITVSEYNCPVDDNRVSLPTIWTGFGIPQSTAQLEAIDVGMADISLLMYLQYGLSTKSGTLLRLRITAGINQSQLMDYRGRINDINISNGYINLANVFYTMTLPAIQTNIKEFSFICPSYLTFTAGIKFRYAGALPDEKYHFLGCPLPRVPIPNNDFVPLLKEHIRAYASISKHFTFTNRGLNYAFPSLERIGAWIQYEDGCFNNFMEAIRESPKLQHVELRIEVVDLEDDNEMTRVPEAQDVWDDVLSFFDHNIQWHKGITTMKIEVTMLFQRHKYRKAFVWGGKSWTALV